METEIEAKFLDIDPSGIRDKLRAIGAELQHPERLMRRRVFDFPDFRLDKQRSWLRVRDEGDRVTLSFKRWIDHSVTGTREAMAVVDDFYGIEKILSAIGLREKSYQETKRELWRIGDVEVTIDTWPWIPAFIEIEGTTEAAIREVVDRLNLDWSGALFGGVVGVYMRYYDVSREEIDRCPRITFSPVPPWLEVRRRHA